MTIHIEQITPEDTALPVWVIYEGEREIARATSEADAERVRAGLDAVNPYLSTDVAGLDDPAGAIRRMEEQSGY